MSDKNSFILYTDYMNQIQLLNMEQRGMLFTAIMEYATSGETDETAMDGMTQMAFSFIKAQMNRDSDKYDETVQKRREAGKLGGRPSEEKAKKANGFSEKAKKANGFSEKAKKANGFSEKQTKAKKPDNDNDDVDVDVNDTEDVDDTEDVNDTVTENKNHRGRVAPGAYYPNDEKLNQAFLEYIKMRKTIKKPMTDNAIQLAMKKLEELSTSSDGMMDDDLAIKILEQSVFRSWQGLFPLDDSGRKKNIFDEWRDA